MSLESVVRSFCSRSVACWEQIGNTPNLHETKVVPTVPVVPSTKRIPLLENEEAAIQAWLAYIKETDQEIIAEVLEKCQQNGETRDFFLLRAEEVPKPDLWQRPIYCGSCIYFERIDHPHLGHCAKSEPEAISGLWDTDRRWCTLWQSLDQNPGNHAHD